MGEILARQFHVPLSAAIGTKPMPDRLAVTMAQRGSLDLEFYAPRGEDRQRPHSRDEIYIIATGSGIFTTPNAENPFVAGDVFFVAANVEHRFTKFSDDFGTWVLFFGPEGGER